MTFNEASLPYCDELKYALNAGQSVSKSTSKTTKSNEKQNDEENEVKSCELMTCLNCIDNNTFMIEQIVLHQMKHELEGETRQNRGAKELSDLHDCFFCGKQSYNQCNLDLYLPPGKKSNYVIKTSCLQGFISGRFYSTLKNPTRKYPFVNHVKNCDECEFVACVWNMHRHYISKHPNETVPPKYIISEFEKKSVEYVGLNGYLSDEKYNLLLSSHRNETLELFGDRAKEKAARKQKKSNKKRKRKSSK